jgi:hypothetical protein
MNRDPNTQPAYLHRGIETAPLVLLLDGEVLARLLLVLIADGLGDQLVLSLLARALVVLGALLEDVLLDPVDTCNDRNI